MVLAVEHAHQDRPESLGLLQVRVVVNLGFNNMYAKTHVSQALLLQRGFLPGVLIQNVEVVRRCGVLVV